MKIRDATREDAEGIRPLYLQAFDASESALVADLAIALLHNTAIVDVISWVAVDGGTIIGHIAFSPVFDQGTGAHVGYILAPLAVLPHRQQVGVGSTLVKYGLDTIAALGKFTVFVYGDPQYYARFGFNQNLAQNFSPPYALQYPEGWQALNLDPTVTPGGGTLNCVAALSNPQLW